MARILGVDLPRNKAMKIAIRSLYGVGPKIGTDVLKAAGIDGEKNSNDLTKKKLMRSEQSLITIL
jgi:small subunit ribosomal protein S13